MPLDLAEKLFQDNNEYAKRMSKRSGKPKIKGIGRNEAVKAEEVLQRLNNLGVKIKSERTLQRWAKEGLIPKPDRKSAGRGKGKITEYHEDTPARGFASWSIIHNKIIGINATEGKLSNLIKNISSFEANVYFEDSIKENDELKDLIESRKIVKYEEILRHYHRFLDKLENSIIIEAYIFLVFSVERNSNSEEIIKKANELILQWGFNIK